MIYHTKLFDCMHVHMCNFTMCDLLDGKEAINQVRHFEGHSSFKRGLTLLEEGGRQSRPSMSISFKYVQNFFFWGRMVLQHTKKIIWCTSFNLFIINFPCQQRVKEKHFFNSLMLKVQKCLLPCQGLLIPVVYHNWLQLVAALCTYIKRACLTSTT